jgi:hypothetical protein
MKAKKGVARDKKSHIIVKRTAKRVHRHFCDHFIPHEGNNHVPHVLKHNVLLGYSVVILLLKILAVTAPIALPSASLYSSSITVGNIVLLTNQTRANLGLGGLTQNAKLAAAAQAKANDMLDKQYFAHNSPDGLTPWYFIRAQGYAYEKAGENLAIHYTTAEGVHDGWLASPTHRANIVKEEFTEIGVGVVNGEYDGYPSTVVVQFFGRPKEPDPPVTSLVVPTTVTQTVPTENTTTEATVPEQKVEDQPNAEEPVINSATNDSVSPSESISFGEENGITTEVDMTETARMEVTPQVEKGTYEVTVATDNAKSVAVQMGSEWVNLEKETEEEVWKGEIVGSSHYNKNGESMQVIIKDEQGDTSVQPAVIAAPDVSVQDFFIFSEAKSKEMKLFGFFSIDNLNDKVKRVYVYMIVFLLAALLMKVLIKVHVQRVSIIAHTLFVVGFTVLLLCV